MIKQLAKALEKIHESQHPYIDNNVYDGDIHFIDEAINNALWEGKEEVLRLAEKYPNDHELGAEIRRLYWDYRYKQSLKRNEKN